MRMKVKDMDKFSNSPQATVTTTGIYLLSSPRRTGEESEVKGEENPQVRPKVGFNVAAVRKMLHGDPNITNADGRKFAAASSREWFDGKPKDKMLGERGPAAFGSKSTQRKAASAMIAKIPYPLAQHIARVFKPEVTA